MGKSRNDRYFTTFLRFINIYYNLWCSQLNTNTLLFNSPPYYSSFILYYFISDYLISLFLLYYPDSLSLSHSLSLKFSHNAVIINLMDDATLPWEYNQLDCLKLCINDSSTGKGTFLGAHLIQVPLLVQMILLDRLITLTQHFISKFKGKRDKALENSLKWLTFS